MDDCNTIPMAQVKPVAEVFDFEAVIERAAIQSVDRPRDDVEESMEMMLAASMEPDHWILQGLIERGDQVMIAGAPKAGKSLMALQIALAVASGGTFLQWRAPAPLRVLYINLEIKRKRMGQRIVSMIGGMEHYAPYKNLGFINSWRTVDVLDEEWQATIGGQIDKIKPDLIVYDVLARMHHADEMTPAMKDVMLQIRLISRDKAHIIVHHTRKPQIDSTTAQTAADMRGSSAIHGEVDLALVLSKRQGQGARYVLTYSARNVGTPDETLLNNGENLCFYEAAEDEENKLLDTLANLFKSAAKAGRGYVMAKEILEHIKNAFLVEDRRAKRYIAQAVDEGWLLRERRTDGLYQYLPTESSPFVHLAYSAKS